MDARVRDCTAPRLTVDDLAAMQPRYFEGFVAALWQKRGYGRVYVTPLQDGGLDVVAIKSRSRDLIQCKTSSTDGTKLDWEAVKDVTGGHALSTRTRA